MLVLECVALKNCWVFVNKALLSELHTERHTYRLKLHMSLYLVSNWKRDLKDHTFTRNDRLLCGVLYLLAIRMSRWSV